MALGVVLLPSAFAYRGEDYLLDEEYGEIMAFLAARDVPSDFPRREFAQEPRSLIDETDHLLPAGDEVMAQVLLRVVKGLVAARATDVP